MNRPLRRAHFAIWIVLPAVLAALLIAIVVVRTDTTPIDPNFHAERYR